MARSKGYNPVTRPNPVVSPAETGVMSQGFDGNMTGPSDEPNVRYCDSPGYSSLDDDEA